MEVKHKHDVTLKQNDKQTRFKIKQMQKNSMENGKLFEVKTAKA